MLAQLKSGSLSWCRTRALKHVEDPGFRALLSTSKIDIHAQWHTHEFLAVDIETTGLDPLSDDVVSFGWVPIVQARIQVQQAARYLVRTDTNINSSAVVHGLRSQDLAQGIKLDEALKHLIVALHNRILLVHYQGLDKVLLDRLCKQIYGARLLVPVADTLEIARHKFRHQTMGSNGFRLSSLCDHFKLPPVQQHDALNDAFATAQVFLALVSRKNAASEPSLAELLS